MEQYQEQIQTNLSKENEHLLIEILEILNIKQFPRHTLIRLRQWLEKLQQPVHNIIWKQNQNLYIKVLKQMIIMGTFMQPFNCLPPQGPLRKITIFDIAYPIRIKIQDDYKKNNKNSQSRDHKSKSVRKNSINILNSTSKYISNRISSISASKKISQAETHRSPLTYENNPSLKIIYDNFLTDRQNSRSKNFKNNNSTNQTNFHTSQSIKLSENQLKQLSKNFIQNKENIRTNGNQIKIIQKQSQQKPNISDKVQKGLSLLESSLKLLGQHYEDLCNQSKYKQLIEGIVKVGDLYHQNFRSIPISSPKKSAPNLKKIKQKFTKTQLDSMQFMLYLNSVRK